MQIEKRITPDAVSEECVVVIDVLRAFTTAAFAFSAGAAKVIAVSTIDEALELKKQDTESQTYLGACFTMQISAKSLL